MDVGSGGSRHFGFGMAGDISETPVRGREFESLSVLFERDRIGALAADSIAPEDVEVYARSMRRLGALRCSFACCRPCSMMPRTTRASTPPVWWASSATRSRRCVRRAPPTEKLLAFGLNAVNMALHASQASLADVLRATRLVGNIVGHILTAPHKIAGAGLVERISDKARAARAVNAIRREPDGSWSGDSFDGAGFGRGIVHDGHDPKGRTVFVARAGGAGCALLAALAAHGVKDLRLYDLSRVRMQAVTARLPQTRVAPILP